jgi:hypothetical protein
MPIRSRSQNEPSSPRNRSRSRERHGLRADASGTNEFEDGCRRPSGHGGAQGDPRARVDGARKDNELLGSAYSTGHRDHSSSSRDNSRRRLGDNGDRRDDARAGEDAGGQERRRDARQGYVPPRASGSRSYSDRRGERRSEPRRDRQCFASDSEFASRPHGRRHDGCDDPRDGHSPHRISRLSPAPGEVRREYRQPIGSVAGSSGRPSAKQIQLNANHQSSRCREHPRDRRGRARRVQCSQRCNCLPPSRKDAPRQCT